MENSISPGKQVFEKESCCLSMIKIIIINFSEHSWSSKFLMELRPSISCFLLCLMPSYLFPLKHLSSKQMLIWIQILLCIAFGGCILLVKYTKKIISAILKQEIREHQFSSVLSLSAVLRVCVTYLFFNMTL